MRECAFDVRDLADEDRAGTYQWLIAVWVRAAVI